MRHDPRNYTRRDIDAALESPHVRDADKAALRAELARRECYSVRERVDYIRQNAYQFEFHGAIVH